MRTEQVKVTVQPDIKNWLFAKAKERRCSVSMLILEILLATMKAELSTNGEPK